MLLLRTHLEAKIDKKKKMVFLLVYLCLQMGLGLFQLGIQCVQLGIQCVQLGAQYSTWLLIQLTPKGVVVSFLKGVFLFYLQVVLCRDGSGSPVPLTKEAIKSAQLTYEGSFKDPEVVKHWSGSGNLR